MANGILAVSQLEMLTQSGTGIVTIVPPATNTNRTLTLPDATGTVATAESTLTQFNASGSAPVYACRAWVNFNGTGTVAIRASGNVSSITDNGSGDYTINFTTGLPDGNYAPVISSNNNTSNTSVSNNNDYASVRTTTAYRFAHLEAANLTDASVLCVSIFR